MTTRKTLTILLILITIPFTIFGTQIEKQVEIDWESFILKITITAPLPSSDSPLPIIKHRMLQTIQRNFPDFLREILLPLTIDSFHTFGDAVHDNPDLIHTVNRIAMDAVLENSRMSPSMDSLILDYRLSLLPLLLEPFVSWNNPTPLNGYLTYEPSARFTGIVIYAADPLPVYGEKNEQGMTRIEKITPCFLTRLFDEDGYEIFSAKNMYPEYLVSRGTAAYVSTMDMTEYQDRVGDYPFYTSARGLYGKNHTDIIISNEDIRRLLSIEENRRLLAEGRIIIIH